MKNIEVGYLKLIISNAFYKKNNYDSILFFIYNKETFQNILSHHFY